ncbi:MAG: hypothetical protein HY708_02690 [Ignavibacteriae bacterium]|nr:hypothetical protein [Ignavibacteriota bacterium]
MKTASFISCCAVLLFSGCIQTIAVRSVGGIVEDGFEALTEEQDLQLAAQAIPGNLKLLEVMLKNDLENTKLLKLVSEGYASYALGFVEDEDPERARLFYLRARDYGLRIVRQNSQLSKAFDGSLDDWKAALSRASKDDVPGIFWTAFAWGSYINISLTDIDAIAALPKVEAMMDFVASVDSTYYYAGAHLFLGTLYGSRPKILGGDPELSRDHFETALRITEGKFLMTHVYYAKSYAAQTLNEALFEELLSTVQKTSLDVLPSFRLGNAIAKKKADLLLSKKEDYF